MKFLLTLLGVIIINISWACDFCGCFMGITPYDNQSNVALLYRYKSFNGYDYTPQQHQLFPSNHRMTSTVNNSGNILNAGTRNNMLKHTGMNMNTATNAERTYSQQDYELYTTAELRAKYFIHKRIELNAVVPFVMNSSKTDNASQQIKGIGDITLFVGYHIISKIYEEKYQHRLIAGAGIKLPVGDYYAKDDSGNRIDFMLQPGTGSIDYMGYLNYIFSYKKVGININTTYKINGYNYYHEQIDNSSTSYLNLFLKLRQEKKLKLFPAIQAYYENTKGLYIDNVYQSGTRTNIAMVGVGVDVFYKNIAINTSFQLPVYEEKLEHNLATAGKFVVGLSYNFNQQNYLIKSKKQE